ncbi:sesquipedalian [Anaeramoeba flamelloides]|uniref:Sesquipedalian n=1 Tax=Anaeramoeba flamelloides TaxID=1746091 RepID=A0ABQ8Z268_9EUKA|nr:sesquipedalian [Anaeramoeba flamelloides]
MSFYDPIQLKKEQEDQRELFREEKEFLTERFTKEIRKKNKEILSLTETLQALSKKHKVSKKQYTQYLSIVQKLKDKEETISNLNELTNKKILEIKQGVNRDPEHYRIKSEQITQEVRKLENEMMEKSRQISENSQLLEKEKQLQEELKRVEEETRQVRVNKFTESQKLKVRFEQLREQNSNVNTFLVDSLKNDSSNLSKPNNPQTVNHNTKIRSLSQVNYNSNSSTTQKKPLKISKANSFNLKSTNHNSTKTQRTNSNPISTIRKTNSSQNSNNITYAGWIYFKTSSGRLGRTKWEKRWMDLKGGILITSKRKGSDILFSMNIGKEVRCTRKDKKETKKDNSLEVRTSTDTILFYTENNTQLTTWFKTFRRFRD